MDQTAMNTAKLPVRVLFCCTGVGIMNRGVESAYREAFDGLKNSPGLQAWLIKGAGERKPDEFPVWCLRRTHPLAKWLGRLIRRNGYTVEQLSSIIPVVAQIRRLRPQVVFYGDANLGFQLFALRKWIGVPYRLIYQNGGPSDPPFDRTDFVHQVAPLYLEASLKSGEAPERHFMIPHGIQIPEPPAMDGVAKRDARSRLNLPQDRPIILSVGWISRQHKRMHYLIEELARLPEPRPFLQMLGAMDESSTEIIELAGRLLGRGNYSAQSVSYEQVANFYRAADIFVLASLQEAFGRVYLEALMYGLPVIAHQHPVMKYILGEHGIFGDLKESGTLSGLIQRVLPTLPDQKSGMAQWNSVRSRFSWEVLKPDYLNMFKTVAAANV